MFGVGHNLTILQQASDHLQGDWLRPVDPQSSLHVRGQTEGIPAWVDLGPTVRNQKTHSKPWQQSSLGPTEEEGLRGCASEACCSSTPASYLLKGADEPQPHWDEGWTKAKGLGRTVSRVHGGRALGGPLCLPMTCALTGLIVWCRHRCNQSRNEDRRYIVLIRPHCCMHA